MPKFTLRKATMQDMSVLMEIYARARVFMKEHSNESQWGLPDPGQPLRPTEDEIGAKVMQGIQYVCLADADGTAGDATSLEPDATSRHNDAPSPEPDATLDATPDATSTATPDLTPSSQIAATFSYTYGIPDPVYSTIFEGSWPEGSETYGVVHSFASAQTVKGAATFCLNWAFEQSGCLKIDTHPNNAPMLNLLNKLGFSYCGKIRFSGLQNSDTLRVAYCKM